MLSTDWSTNYNNSLEKLQDFFFKTETKTKCPRPRLHDPRPRSRLSCLSSRRLETKTLSNQQIHADIQTNVTISENPVEFWQWLNSCPKPYSQLSVLAVDLLAAPASQAVVERLFSVCGMLSHGRRNRVEKSLEMKVWLRLNKGRQL